MIYDKMPEELERKYRSIEAIKLDDTRREIMEEERQMKIKEEIRKNNQTVKEKKKRRGIVSWLGEKLLTSPSLQDLFALFWVADRVNNEFNKKYEEEAKKVWEARKGPYSNVPVEFKYR
jgi:hypothetical protein